MIASYTYALIVNLAAPDPDRHPSWGLKIRFTWRVVFRVKITPQIATDSDSVLLEYMLEYRPF